MSYENAKEERAKRNKRLVEGMCVCGLFKAQIPWKNKKFCYKCWEKFWQKENKK